MEIFSWSVMDHEQRKLALSRPRQSHSALSEQVSHILNQVKTMGDRAVLGYAKKLDAFQGDNFLLPDANVQSLTACIDSALREAIDEAYERIKKFHMSSVPAATRVETAQGVSCEYRYQGYNKVGIYIPGGSAPLISTVLMTGVPAQLAQVSDISLCTPTDRFENISPGILYAAQLCGVQNVYCIGGAHAIAAMAFGTDRVDRVQKIFGPGNSWVTEAKQQVAFDPEGAAIDMPAGPSEVMIIADDTAKSEFVVMDLLSQLEHGPDSQAILISTEHELLSKVSYGIIERSKEMSRSEILEQSLKNVRLIYVDHLDDAVQVSNQYAPEHLLLQVNAARELVNDIHSAGSVFLGNYTPESLGDYCSGTNHVLPTYGFARAYNGLSVIDYMQRMTIQEASPEGIQNIGPCAMLLADAEGLEAHQLAVSLRLDNIRSERQDVQ